MREGTQVLSLLLGGIMNIVVVVLLCVIGVLFSYIMYTLGYLNGTKKYERFNNKLRPMINNLICECIDAARAGKTDAELNQMLKENADFMNIVLKEK